MTLKYGEEERTAIWTHVDGRETRSALTALLRADIHVTATTEGLQVDTPYILSNGALLRVMVRPGAEPEQVVVTDGGYACEQVEISTRSDAALRSHHREMREIARQLGLEWDVEFRHTSTSS